jgi:hypothetical protein
MGFDWFLFFYPALQQLWQGQSPYSVDGFVTPPWVLPILAPLALTPPVVGALVVDALALVGLVALCRKHQLFWAMLPLALCYPMLMLLWNAQLEGFVLWGLVLGPTPFGFFLLMTKPQVAGLVSLVWLIEAWRVGGGRRVLWLGGPTAVVMILSVAIYPDWLQGLSQAAQWSYTANGFPYSVALGAACLVFAVRHQREEWAALATLLLVPYANVQSWMAALTLLTARYRAEGVSAALASWILAFYLEPTRW